jgi:hypothetical protein
MTYIVEYLVPNEREWRVYFTYGKGTKTNPLSIEQFLRFDECRQAGEYVFLSVEVCA